MKNVIAFAAFAVLVTVAADPALAQGWGGGGGNVPFREGLNQFSNWVFVLGCLVALIAMVGIGVAAFMQNIKGVIGGVVGVIVGATLIAKAPQILATLTGLNVNI